MKKIIFFQLLFLCLHVHAQECGNCKTTPSVAFYDLDVQVPQPELKGEKTKGWLEWQQLFWLARHAHAYLFKKNNECIRFTQPSSNDNDELVIGATTANLAPANKNISAYGNYFITGVIKKQGNDYLLKIEMQTSCNRKVVASASVGFQLSSESSNTIKVATEAASQLSPLIEKIKKFERDERSNNKKFAIAGNDIDRIKVTPAKVKLKAGDQTPFTIELSDCDGVSLPGREIVFTQESIGGNKMPGTIGGTVTPAKVTTDANGKAKAVFHMGVTGKSAVINAHTVTATPQNCQGVLFGDAQIDAMPAYKVAINYIKTRSADLSMKSNEDGVVLKANEQSQENVAYSFSLIHYPLATVKERDQIMIMPQFQEDPEYQKVNMGTTIVLHNEGYSEYTITGTDLELVQSPFGAEPSEGEKGQRYFSDSPLPPSVSLLFKDNNLVFFSGGVEFPEVEDGLSPVSSSFSLNEEDKSFPVVPKKITDPASPYKWLYEFVYNKKDSYNQQGKVFKQGSSEVETARVQVWRSF